MNLSAIIAARHRATAGFSTEAQDYFDRLDTAGDTTYTAYKQPLANYIDSLVALGGAYWDDMLSAASFVGVGIQGVTVPLRDGMTVPTNNNFVAGDLDQLTGLKGNGWSKSLDLGLNNNDFTLGDASFGVYITETDTSLNEYIGTGNVANRSSLGSRFFNSNIETFNANQCPAILEVIAAYPIGFYATSRSSGAAYSRLINGTTSVRSAAASTPGADPVSVFSGGGNAFWSSARLATYHAGAALDLATLEGLQDTLITEVEAVWNTLVYQSDFANGATEWTAARGTNTAPDSPDASTNVMSYVPNVGIQTHYTRLSTSNINLTDEYLTQFEIYIPSSNVTVDGFKVTDWTSTTVFDNTIPTSDTWKSISFISKYENVGVPAIWQTAAGAVSFNGNGTDKIYIRNFRVLKQS